MKKIYFVFACILCAGSISAQTVPNGSFENWNETQGYPEPDNWATLNILSLFTGADFGVTQGTPGAVGNSYCSLICTEDMEGMATPALAITGSLNLLTGSGATGFPVNNLPNFLSGQYRSTINGDDLAGVACFFTRWNDAEGIADTVAIGSFQTFETQSSWTDFDISIVPMMTGTPDTCVIVMIAGGGNFPEVGNSLDIDDLHFTGGTVSVDESAQIQFNAWPNPMNEQLMLDLTSQENVNEITLYDMQGRLMEQWQLGATQVSLDVAQLPAGSYVLHVTNRSGRWTQSLLKQ